MQVNGINSGSVKWIYDKSAQSTPKITVKKEDDDFPEIIITHKFDINAEKLGDLLKSLKVMSVNQTILKNIAYYNGVLDNEEKLNELDDYLEKAIGWDILIKYGIDYWFGPGDEKFKNKTFIKALIRLKKAGVLLDFLAIRELSEEKAADRNYINALIELNRAGIKIDAHTISFLTREKLNDKDYVKVLIMLQTSGDVVGIYPFFHLTLEKAKSGDFIKALFELNKSGNKIRGDIIKTLTIEDTQNQEYIKTLAELAKAGILIDEFFLSRFTKKKAKNKELVNNLIELHQVGIELYASIEGDWIRIAPDYITESHIKGLSKLSQEGLVENPVEVDYILEKSQEYREKAKALGITYPEMQIPYPQGYARLARMWFISPEKADDDEEIFIKTLVELKKAGIEIDYFLIDALTVEKANNKNYIDTLIALHKSGIKITANLIEAIPEDKITHKEFIGNVLKNTTKVNSNKEIHKNRILITSCNFVRATIGLQKIGLDPLRWEVYEVLPRLAEDDHYLETLFDLIKHGVHIDGHFIRSFTTEESKNRNYIEKLKQN